MLDLQEKDSLNIKKKSFKEAFPDINDEKAYDILEKMLVFDPDKRASAEEILQHPYFKEN